MPSIQLEAKYRAPFQAWKQSPGPAQAGELLRSLEPIINTGVRSYGGANPSPLLRSRARKIVLDSIVRYDPTRTKLSTFLMQQLQGLRRIRFEEGQAIKVPEQVRLDQMNLQQAEQELRDRLGRIPSTIELSDHTHLSPARITKIRGVHSGLAESSMTSTSNSDEGIFSPAVKGNTDKNWMEFIHHGLAPRDQLIMEHTTGLFGRKQISNIDIAKKLNVTPSAISQRRAKIQDQLNQREGLGVF